jgi:putative transposase
MSVAFGHAEVLNNKKLEALAAELAKPIKTEQDIGALSRQLLKLTVERALNAEREEPLGYAKHAPAGRGTGNSRNGHSPKTLKGERGEVAIQTPRDRQGRFEPQLIGKGQTRLRAFDDQILARYAKGMSTGDSADAVKERYGAAVSHRLIANVTAAVLETVPAWHSRPLDRVYPLL